jgi:hypothetical protein
MFSSFFFEYQTIHKVQKRRNSKWYRILILNSEYFCWRYRLLGHIQSLTAVPPIFFQVSHFLFPEVCSIIYLFIHPSHLPLHCLLHVRPSATPSGCFPVHSMRSCDIKFTYWNSFWASEMRGLKNKNFHCLLTQLPGVSYVVVITVCLKLKSS